MKKVRYVGDYYKVSLRKNKVYEVLSSKDGWYSLLDESGEEYLFPSDMFEVVEE